MARIYFIFCLTKSLQGVISFLCFVNIGICSPVSRDAAAYVGENIGDEAKNKICRDYFGSSEYIWVPELNKCEPCSFACARSTEAYCKACPAGSTTPAETTSSAPPTQAATTVQTTIVDPILPTASDHVITGGSVADPPITFARSDGSDGNRNRAPLENWKLAVIILSSILCTIIVVLIVFAWKRNKNEQVVRERENVETIPEEMMPLPVQDSQPRPSIHPMSADLNGATDDPLPGGTFTESTV